MQPVNTPVNTPVEPVKCSPRHKSIRVNKSFDAMQRLVFPLTHFKANRTKISQKCVQRMAIEACLCLSCVMEKCHKLSIVPYEIGYGLGRAIVLFQFA